MIGSLGSSRRGRRRAWWISRRRCGCRPTTNFRNAYVPFLPSST
jgi:hypothetical protein